MKVTIIDDNNKETNFDTNFLLAATDDTSIMLGKAGYMDILNCLLAIVAHTTKELCDNNEEAMCLLYDVSLAAYLDYNGILNSNVIAHKPGVDINVNHYLAQELVSKFNELTQKDIQEESKDNE